MSNPGSPGGPITYDMTQKGKVLYDYRFTVWWNWTNASVVGILRKTIREGHWSA